MTRRFGLDDEDPIGDVIGDLILAVMFLGFALFKLHELKERKGDK